MMLYAESSAPLAWLLEQAHGERVADLLAAAEHVVTSELTFVECDRVLIRAVVLHELEEADAVDRQARLNAVAEKWTVVTLNDEILERARRPFPAEPVRTLDALHLASVLTLRRLVPDVAMLTLDNRVRMAGSRLGIPIVPSDADLGS